MSQIHAYITPHLDPKALTRTQQTVDCVNEVWIIIEFDVVERTPPTFAVPAGLQDAFCVRGLLGAPGQELVGTPPLSPSSGIG